MFPLKSSTHPTHRGQCDDQNEVGHFISRQGAFRRSWPKSADVDRAEHVRSARVFQTYLIDHHAVYGELGIQAQFSFDADANEISRQKFNRPTGKTICEVMNSADLPGKIDTIFERFRSKKNLIVWLDYTKADERRRQLQEAVQALVKLKHGDVFRITLNANAQTLGEGDDWKKFGAANPAEYRAIRLREQVAEFLPTSITAIGEQDFPKVLAQCVHLAATEAERLQANLRVEPVLTTSYRDGQRMLTVSAQSLSTTKRRNFPVEASENGKFASSGWDDLELISAPQLSLKEQYCLDAYLHRGVKRMIAALGFLPAKDETASLDVVSSYRTYQRYYPTFRHVED